MNQEREFSRRDFLRASIGAGIAAVTAGCRGIGGKGSLREKGRAFLEIAKAQRDFKNAWPEGDVGDALKRREEAIEVAKNLKGCEILSWEGRDQAIRLGNLLSNE